MSRNKSNKMSSNLTMDEAIELMEEYLETHEKIKARDKYKGYSIGNKQAHLRTDYYNGILEIESEQERRLLDLGVLRKEKERETADSLTWEEKFLIMQEYINMYGAIKYDTVYKGYKIGEWQRVARHLYLTNDDNKEFQKVKDKFLDLGIIRKKKKIPGGPGNTRLSYEEKYELMSKYLRKQGPDAKIKAGATIDGYNLCAFKDNLIQAYKKR